MRILFVFVDGVGIGPRDASINPFLQARLPVLNRLVGGLPFLDAPALTSDTALLIPLDATLGTPGVPQSATGQTALLTGVNAAAHIGEHYGPYPDERLRHLLENSIFQRLAAGSRRATFANAYPPAFFARVERGTDRRSAICWAAGAAALPYRTQSDLARGEAVSASLTNERFPYDGVAVPLISARQAGRNLERLSRRHEFTLYEFFLTDVAGHRPARLSAVAILEALDDFLGGVLDEFDRHGGLLVVTSDHGNIEDVSTRRHTRNPVPALVVGSQRREFASRLHSLTDVTPAILEIIG